MSVYVFASMSLCVFVRARVKPCVYVCVRVRLYVCACMCARVCIFVCACVCKCLFRFLNNNGNCEINHFLIRKHSPIIDLTVSIN